MFQVGDRIAHPMHGAGVINGIVERTVNGVVRSYYELKLPNGDMMVMVPTENSEKIGVRPVIDKEQGDRVLAALEKLQVEMNPNWNRRYRENMVRLKSGNLLDVAWVLKGLMLRDEARGGLSTGERKMLCSAKQILISELAFSQSSSYEEIEERINRALA